jgi:hypothetical protein
MVHSGWLTRHGWVRQLAGAACSVLALSGVWYACYQEWDRYRARQCALTNGYWIAHGECVPRRDRCQMEGRTLALGERYYDGCNWWTCDTYFWKVTSKYCFR